MTLREKVLKAAAFNNRDGNGFDFERGRQRENARLSPLTEALAECADILADWSKGDYDGPEWVDKQEQALAKLEALLKETDK